MNRVAVIGGGPAGVFAAIAAAENGAQVALYEKNGRLGRKLGITGKGRCNVTNLCDRDAFIDSVRNNPRFLYSAYAALDCRDVVDFFEKRGVKLKVERGGRVFPESDKAHDIVAALEKAAARSGVETVFSNVSGIVFDGGAVKGIKAGGKVREFDAAIVATGGLSYSATGCTGDGYRFAKSAGHTIVEPYAALVPFECEEAWCADAAGLGLKNVAVALYGADGKKIYAGFGELLFTHFGVSGPVVLSASSNLSAQAAGCRLEIDLKPALDEATLDRRILRDFELFKNKNIENGLEKLIPKSLIAPVARAAGIPEGSKVNSITKTQRQALLKTLKSLTLTIKGKRPVEEAIVTGGGVSVTEIDKKTMQSKLVRGLYFAGEVMDVDAYTGGFNLQIAFSTGYLAGVSSAKTKED